MVNANRDINTPAVPPVASRELDLAARHFAQGQLLLLRARPQLLEDHKQYVGMLTKVASQLVVASKWLEKAQPKYLRKCPERVDHS